MDSYQAPWWLPGGHAQTIYAKLIVRRTRVAYRRERWETPDGDFIDLDWLEEPPAVVDRSRKSRLDKRRPSANADRAPLVVLFHGLEGSSRGNYALAMMAALRDRGMRGVVVHFRGCSGEPNRLARAYHSGDAPEIDWILRRLQAGNAGCPLFAAGISLGGN